MDDDDSDYFLMCAPDSPAEDVTARVLRWVGLVGGVGLCLTVILRTLP